MTEAEVGMVNCPVITQQPTNSIYDPSVYKQGLNESVYVEVKYSPNEPNNIRYEWYLDGEKLPITDNPSLDLVSSGKNPDVYTMYTVTGIIYNCPEGWEEGQPLSKKDGFVRINVTVKTPTPKVTVKTPTPKKQNESNVKYMPWRKLWHEHFTQMKKKQSTLRCGKRAA